LFKFSADDVHVCVEMKISVLIYDVDLFWKVLPNLLIIWLVLYWLPLVDAWAVVMCTLFIYSTCAMVIWFLPVCNLSSRLLGMALWCWNLVSLHLLVQKHFSILRIGIFNCTTCWLRSTHTISSQSVWWSYQYCYNKTTKLRQSKWTVQPSLSQVRMLGLVRQ